MHILAIETSCDETSAAVVSSGNKILSNVVATQTEFHQKYGGIVPEIASRKHIELISPVIQEALDKAKTSFKKIDAVACTYGPGLVGSLLIGLCAAKAIAWSCKIPLIGVNHLEGHIYANFLGPHAAKPPRFPFICLIVSGGHTSIVYAKKAGQYETLGRTRDDAAGEAFDKVARVLKLGYPGGPVIDGLAQHGNPHAIEFKRPMIERNFGYDFSFSGIKTGVINFVNKHKGFKVEDLAASFQAAVVDVLVEKTFQAAKDKKVKTICLAGGVSANSGLRERFEECANEGGVTSPRLQLFVPPLSLCTDNAAMIGAAAYHKFKNKEFADLSLRPVASLKI